MSYIAGTPYERGNNEVVVNERLLRELVAPKNPINIEQGLFCAKNANNDLAVWTGTEDIYGIAGVYYKDDCRQQVVQIANSIYVQAGVVTSTKPGAPLYVDLGGAGGINTAKVTDVKATTGIFVGYLKSFVEDVPNVFTGDARIDINNPSTVATCVRMDLVRPVVILDA